MPTQAVSGFQGWDLCALHQTVLLPITDMGKSDSLQSWRPQPVKERGWPRLVLVPGGMGAKTPGRGEAQALQGMKEKRQHNQATVRAGRTAGLKQIEASNPGQARKQHSLERQPKARALRAGR